MTATEPRNGMEPFDDASEDAFPPRFAEALNLVRDALAAGETTHVPPLTLVAALTAELMPRLVHAYGEETAASVLRRLAAEIAAEISPAKAGH